MYVTYGIVDPESQLFVYVGQTSDFEERKKAHLSARRLKAKPRNRVKAWLWTTLKAKRAPQFIILDIVETEAGSLASEQAWVEKIAAIGHPLLNGWEEHRDAISKAVDETARKRARGYAIAKAKRKRKDR